MVCEVVARAAWTVGDTITLLGGKENIWDTSSCPCDNSNGNLTMAYLLVSKCQVLYFPAAIIQSIAIFVLLRD